MGVSGRVCVCASCFDVSFTIFILTFEVIQYSGTYWIVWENVFQP